MFGEKVEEIETIVKEAASDGYNFVAHHKPLAVLVAVLVILGLIGIVTVRRNKTKSGKGAVGDKATATKVAAKKVVGKDPGHRDDSRRNDERWRERGFLF